jgi:phosphate uptake regulator
MKRKVIKQGNGTLTITLPKNWTKEIGLKGGDEIEVEAVGKNLFIKSEGIKTDKRIDITLESNHHFYVQQVLRNLYLSGYDKIRIRFFDSKSIVEINKAVDDLLGYQIIEQSGESCLIDNLSPVVETQFLTLLRKIFLLNKSLFETLLADLKNKDLEHIDAIKGTVKNIYRFGNYCRRTIIKKPMFDELESTKMYLLIVRLITVSHSIAYIYDQLSGKKRMDVSKEFLDFAKKAYEYYGLFYQIYYERKLKDIYKLSVLKDELLNKELPRLLEKKDENKIIIHYAAQIVRDIYRNGGILFTLKEEKVSSFSEVASQR